MKEAGKPAFFIAVKGPRSGALASSQKPLPPQRQAGGSQGLKKTLLIPMHTALANYSDGKRIMELGLGTGKCCCKKNGWMD